MMIMSPRRSAPGVFLISVFGMECLCLFSLGPLGPVSAESTTLFLLTAAGIVPRLCKGLEVFNEGWRLHLGDLTKHVFGMTSMYLIMVAWT